MNHPLSTDLKSWIEDKVRQGEYSSEEAVVEAALRSLRTEERGSPDDLIDETFVAYCEREADEGITIDDVRAATSAIPGSMAEVIIEEERAERF